MAEISGKRLERLLRDGAQRSLTAKEGRNLQQSHGPTRLMRIKSSRSCNSYNYNLLVFQLWVYYIQKREYLTILQQNLTIYLKTRRYIKIVEL